MGASKWFGAKTIYQIISNTVRNSNNLFEERVIILKARSIDQAISKAEKEASLYASDGSGIRYLGYINVFKISDEEIQDKTEVFSLMREAGWNPRSTLIPILIPGQKGQITFKLYRKLLHLSAAIPTVEEVFA